MNMLLKLDLQLFADGEDDLDIDSMLAEFEEEYEEPGEDLDTEEIDTEDEGEPTTQEEDQTEETETQPNPNDEDADKRNRAFADMRRELETAKKYADALKRIAEEGGVNPDELLERYEERRLQAQAEQTGVPVEFLQKQTATEARLQQLEENLRAERIDAQVNQAIEKYGATDDDIRGTFQYMMESGVDPRVAENIDFEKFYRAANLDKIIQKEVENARQTDLENKKKRQESASIGNGTSVSPSNNELTEDEFNAELERLGIRF
jgi:hypothetical protein